jgi:LmbE family N-acetylglucosaminyl deacetylase
MSESLNTLEQNPEGWKSRKKILVILAHPDDPEFFCGASIAHWVALGHEVSYCLLTKGQRGTQDPEVDPMVTAGIRVGEQLNAAGVLGVSNIRFLEHMDGELVADLALRNEVIKEIRLSRPDIVVTCDPRNLFPAENRINHPDHRATGQVVLDAIFPATGNPGYNLAGQDGQLPAHQVEEVWLSLTLDPNFALNMTDLLDTKINALLAHQSQIRLSQEKLRETFASRFEKDPDSNQSTYYEKFHRIILA